MIDAQSLEPIDVLHWQLPILGTSCDDHCARRHPGTVLDVDSQRLAITIEPHSTLGNQQLGPELLSLRPRRGCEVLARDAGWKAQIIFNPRARSRLPSRCIRLHNEDIQSLGRCIYSSCKTRWPTSHDHHIANVSLID